MTKKNYSILWKNAKNYILGGNMLLSKRPEMFLPDLWPTYFSKAQKINVWDLNGKKYKDFVFAVGQSTLGYANPSIDMQVKKAITKGNMTTLNCHEEVELAKKLIKLHKWADKVKFARSGGEANALSIRIARSACKKNKDNIAICGYHGWHDWYLSVNLKSKDLLNTHLLPGLDPIGVPKELKNKTHPFEYGNFEQLLKIHKKYKLGIVKLEIARNNLPDIIFLKKIRKFCNQNKIILIFDECTSGFRYNLGGLHLTTKVNPDIAMFGKAIGNGYAISAVIGKKKIMDKAIKSFISSTFWTERSGYVAGLKTIEFMENYKTYNKLKINGNYLISQWKKLSKKYNLNLEISNMPCICNFKFKKNNNFFKTFITKEMLKKGYLASNMVYVSIYHNKKNIDKYIKNLDPIFKKIKLIINDKKTLKKITKLSSENTFKRLIN
tara:strand:- start:26072 stop:27385 length:1314 start_codon:yes stop_codon:yes gene_type:complete